MSDWDDIQKKVKERDQKKAEQDQQRQTLTNDQLKPRGYKTSKGEVARLAEKDFYHKLATSGYMEKVLDDMNKLVNDPAKAYTEETKQKVADLNEKLQKMWTNWKKYTESYVQITGSRDAYKESKSAEAFLKDLDECVQFFEGDDYAFMKNKIADEQPMLSCYTTLKHLEGHYEEMTKGSLVLDGVTEVEDYSKMEPVVFDTKDLREKIANKKEDDPELEAEVVMEEITGPLIPHEISANDVQQGHLGDCYFVASAAAVALNNGQELRKRMKDVGDGVIFEINSVYSNTDYGKKELGSDKRYVKVSKKIPYIRYYKTVNGERKLVGKEQAYAQSSPWVQVLEKAEAMMGALKTETYDYEMSGHGLYHEMESGTTEEAMTSLFGAENIKNQIIENDPNSEEQWHRVCDEMKAALKQNKIITCASSDDQKIQYNQQIKSEVQDRLSHDEEYAALTDKKEKEDYADSVRGKVEREMFKGVLLAKHAYTVAGVLDHYPTRKDGRCIVVRNPHGNYDYDPKKDGLVNFNNFDPEKNKVPNGYSVITDSDFKAWFTKVVISDISPAKERIDPGQDIRRLSAEIFNGLDASRSKWAKKSMSFASKDFQDFYNAAKEVRDLTKSSICSSVTLNKALDRMKTAAQKYYDNRKDTSMEFDERNVRFTLSKAAIGMCNAFPKRETQDLKAEVRNITEQMLKDRLDYNAALNKKANDYQRPEVETLMKRLPNEEIFKLAMTKGDKLPAAVSKKKEAIAESDRKDRELREKDEQEMKAQIKAKPKKQGPQP